MAPGSPAPDITAMDDLNLDDLFGGGDTGDSLFEGLDEDPFDVGDVVLGELEAGSGSDAVAEDATAKPPTPVNDQTRKKDEPQTNDLASSNPSKNKKRKARLKKSENPVVGSNTTPATTATKTKRKVKNHKQAPIVASAHAPEALLEQQKQKHTPPSSTSATNSSLKKKKKKTEKKSSATSSTSHQPLQRAKTALPQSAPHGAVPDIPSSPAPGSTSVTAPSSTSTTKDVVASPSASATGLTGNKQSELVRPRSSGNKKDRRKKVDVAPAMSRTKTDISQQQAHGPRFYSQQQQRQGGSTGRTTPTATIASSPKMTGTASRTSSSSSVSASGMHPFPSGGFSPQSWQHQQGGSGSHGGAPQSQAPGSSPVLQAQHASTQAPGLSPNSYKQQMHHSFQQRQFQKLQQQANQGSRLGCTSPQTTQQRQHMSPPLSKTVHPPPAQPTSISTKPPLSGAFSSRQQDNSKGAKSVTKHVPSPNFCGVSPLDQSFYPFVDMPSEVHYPLRRLHKTFPLLDQVFSALNQQHHNHHESSSSLNSPGDPDQNLGGGDIDEAKAKALITSMLSSSSKTVGSSKSRADFVRELQCLRSLLRRQHEFLKLSGGIMQRWCVANFSYKQVEEIFPDGLAELDSGSAATGAGTAAMRKLDQKLDSSPSSTTSGGNSNLKSTAQNSGVAVPSVDLGPQSSASISVVVSNTNAAIPQNSASDTVAAALDAMEAESANAPPALTKASGAAGGVEPEVKTPKAASEQQKERAPTAHTFPALKSGGKHNHTDERSTPPLCATAIPTKSVLGKLRLSDKVVILRVKIKLPGFKPPTVTIRKQNEKKEINQKRVTIKHLTAHISPPGFVITKKKGGNVLGSICDVRKRKLDGVVDEGAHCLQLPPADLNTRVSMEACKREQMYRRCRTKLASLRTERTNNMDKLVVEVEEMPNSITVWKFFEMFNSLGDFVLKRTDGETSGSCGIMQQNEDEARLMGIDALEEVWQPEMASCFLKKEPPVVTVCTGKSYEEDESYGEERSIDDRYGLNKNLEQGVNDKGAEAMVSHLKKTAMATGEVATSAGKSWISRRFSRGFPSLFDRLQSLLVEEGSYSTAESDGEVDDSDSCSTLTGNLDDDVHLVDLNNDGKNINGSKSQGNVFDISSLTLDQRTYIQLRAVHLVDRPLLPSPSPVMQEYSAEDQYAAYSTRFQTREDDNMSSDLCAKMLTLQDRLSDLNRRNNIQAAHLEQCSSNYISHIVRNEKQREEETLQIARCVQLVQKRKKEQKHLQRAAAAQAKASNNKKDQQ